MKVTKAEQRKALKDAMDLFDRVGPEGMTKFLAEATLIARDIPRGAVSAETDARINAFLDSVTPKNPNALESPSNAGIPAEAYATHCVHGLTIDQLTGQHIVKVHHMGQLDIPEVADCA